MTSISNATVCCILISFLIPLVHPHVVSTPRTRKEGGSLRMEPSESIVFPGDNVTFTCFHPSNVSFKWDFNSEIHSFYIRQGKTLTSTDGTTAFFSKLTLYSTTRRMSGEVVCSVIGGDLKAIGFLIVNGVRNGGSCRVSSDCMTDKAMCQDGICECPRNYVRVRVKDRGFDICREMIYSLYDPCEYNEQCAHLVDPMSICKAVCICGPSTRDRRGKCVSLSDISNSKSQEMYRVGLIAVTCIIILIVAVSLWVTLKRSCHENTMEQQNSLGLSNRLSIDMANDKPPSYDDVLVTEDVIGQPPNIKDALKHCMTAKKLLRQVSAPAGQLLSQPIMNNSKPVSKELHPS